MQVPFITAADVEAELDWAEIVAALDAGHRSPRAEMSDQLLSGDGSTLLSRAAWIEGLGIAVKSVTVTPENPARGLPSIHGAMVLFEGGTGQFEAVIDSGLVTKWKTAADSVLGAQYLARPDSRKLLVVGAGVVARSMIEAYSALFSGIEIGIWSRRDVQAEELASETGATAVADLEAAVGTADIVSTATMATSPVIRGDWLRPGQHLDLIGAFTPAMREADDTALRRARIFVDCRETTTEHIGELMKPIANRVISPTDILGDLYDLAGGAVGRTAPGDVTLFKNGGGGHLDLMTGRVILDVWRRSRA